MPVMQRPDGEIHYEEHGYGYPVLLCAAGRSRTTIEAAVSSDAARYWRTGAAEQLRRVLAFLDRHTLKVTRKAA